MQPSSEEKLFALDEIPAAAVRLSADGLTITHANALAAALVGSAEGELPSLQLALDTDQLARLRDVLATMPQVVETQGWELRRVTGDLRLVSIRGRRATDGSYLLILHDRTADARVQEALRDSERRWSNTAANVPGALFRYILRSDGSDAVVYMSDGCRQLWELEPGSIVQDAGPMWAMVFPEDVQAMQQSVMHSGQTMTNWDHRWRIRTPSGKVKWLHGIGKPVQMGPDILWDSLILDVTGEVNGERERAALHSELERARRLEAIGRLAGGIAHDFNNLLMIIISGAESVESLSPLPDEAAHEVEHIRDAALRAAALTRKLLLFARMPGATRGSVVPAMAIQEGRKTLERFVAPGVTLQLDTANSSWAVGLDAAEFDQVVTNLLVNASMATAAGGRIDLRLRDLAAGEAGNEGGSCVELVVADSGRGMSAEVLDHIFEPFFTTRGEEGTGLGLATVYGLVSEVGGTIQVQSVPGSGSTFTLRFPPVVLPIPEPEGVPAEARGSGQRVLVVDDEPSVLRATVRTLRMLGYDAHGADSAEDALLDLARSAGETSALISDIVMPVMGGPELAAEVQRQWPKLRVMLISGYSPRSFDSAGSALPVLSKPFTRAKLSAAMRDLLA